MRRLISPALSRLSGRPAPSRSVQWHRGAAPCTGGYVRAASSSAESALAAGTGHADTTTSYDYVIVGAGSAGCVLANRLSVDPTKRVLLLEAGGQDTYPWIHIPVGYLYTQNNPRTCWCFETSDQPGLNDRRINYPRGKVVGGCSSINGMIYMRGQARDYDGWAEEFGCEGWSWAEMEKVFDRSLKSNGGEWGVEGQRLSWDVLESFKDAAKEKGIPTATTFRSSDAESCGYFEVNQKRGVRLSAYRAFVAPIESDRPNLTIVRSAHATKIAFEQQPDGDSDSGGIPRATGVEWVTLERPWLPSKDTDVVAMDALPRQRAVAAKEVILAAGAIGSPHLLQVSGVGPAELLEKHGVDVVADMPGVGGNLHDHLQIRAIYKLSEETDTMNKRANSIIGQIRMGLEYFFYQSGPLSMAPSQLGAFVKSTPERESPDLQFHVQPLSLDKFGDPLHTWPGITASVCNLRPTSRGSVTLTGPSTFSKPHIDPNYLNTARDRKVAAESLKLTRRIMLESDAFARYKPEEYLPGPGVKTDEDLAVAAGNIGTSIFHPVGTCRMGGTEGDDNVVVDPRLRVKGIQGLRVVDASIMPKITSGNTNSPTIAIAEKGAAMIIEDHQ